MINLQYIQTLLSQAMKEKDQLKVDVLRGLKTRIQNEQVAKLKPELSEEEVMALVRSEVKKRKEAAEGFKAGGKPELAEKEQKEAEVLQAFLPTQLSEEQVLVAVKEFLAGGEYKSSDFGKAMAGLKAKLGSSADGALLAKVLKANLS